MDTDLSHLVVAAADIELQPDDDVSLTQADEDEVGRVEFNDHAYIEPVLSPENSDLMAIHPVILVQNVNEGETSEDVYLDQEPTTSIVNEVHQSIASEEPQLTIGDDASTMHHVVLFSSEEVVPSNADDNEPAAMKAEKPVKALNRKKKTSANVRPSPRYANGNKSPSSWDTNVSQSWFTTKDDKVALQDKGHQWKQGQWSHEEVALLETNIQAYCQKRSIDDPAFVIFNVSKDERKDFYRTIAKGLNRPLFSVYRRVVRMYDQKNHLGKYSPDEIKQLKQLRMKHGSDWTTIGAFLGRSASSVKDRCRLMKDCNSGKWLPEEESRLTQAVYELAGVPLGEEITHGLSWAMVAERVATRSEKQCRTKWLNYLNWKQKGGVEWTREDDITLIKKLSEMSVLDDCRVDWARMAKELKSARSPQWLRGKWWTIKRHVDGYQYMALPNILAALKAMGMMDLKMRSIDDRPVKKPVHRAGPSKSAGPSEPIPVTITEDGTILDSRLVEIPAEQQQMALDGQTLLLTPSLIGSEHFVVHMLPIEGDNTKEQPVYVTQQDNGQLAQLQVEPCLQLVDQAFIAQPMQILATPNSQEETSELEVPQNLIMEPNEVDMENVTVVSLTPEMLANSEVEFPSTNSVEFTTANESASSDDLMQKMSSLSDPMLPTENDLICPSSDIEKTVADSVESEIESPST